MLSDADRQISKEFQQRLEALLPVYDFRIFGSRARGDADIDSDLDIFIEVEAITPLLRKHISEIAWEVGFEKDIVISTLVVTKDQLKHGAVGANPIIQQIEREGIKP